MGWASFKEICQEELRLDPAGQKILKEAVRNFMIEWDKKYDELWSRDEHRAYDPETLNQIAATYVQEGLYTATTKISPGKNLWTSSSITSDKPGYIYPRDKKAIVEGIEKLVAKIQQGQERYQNVQQPASVRAGKRKRDKESQQEYIEKDNELELPDIDDLRKDMTPQSLQKPRRQSDRIKQNTYPTLNFDVDEDFLRSLTAQTQADEARVEDDHNKHLLRQNAADGHSSSSSESDEQQVRSSKRLLWPSVGSRSSRQITLTHPIKSLQEATTLKKASPAQPMSIARFFRPKIETADRDVVILDKTSPTMQSSVPRSRQRASYQSESDSMSVDVQPLESITGASVGSEALEPTKSAPKLRTPVKGSQSEVAAKTPRPNVASRAASTEQGLAMDIIDKGEESPSKGIYSSRDPVAAMTDPRSPTLAAEPRPEGPADRLRPSRTDPPRSSVHSSPSIDRLSMRGEESESIEERAKVTRLSESHQNRVFDQPVQVVRSGQSTHFWILKNRPRQAWVLWRGADLVKENLQSVFAAVTKHTDCTNFRSLEIMLETPQQSFTFPVSEEDSDHFEDMKRFMKNMIETSSRERHDSSTSPRIWISPIEMN